MPYDPEQAQRQAAGQRQAERESAARMEGTKKSPLQSSGGGGFVSNAAGSGSDKAADPPGKYDGGLSGGVIHSAAVEQNIHDKALGGGVITNDDIGDAHGYLGHFAGDDVLRKGHNVGHKPKGKSPLVKTTAKKGFRKLPGSASVVQGHAKYGEPDLGTRAPRPEREKSAKLKAEMTRAMKKSAVMQHDPVPLSRAPMGGFGSPRAVSSPGSMPPTTANQKMSLKHERERVAFNVKHEKDHHKDAQEARRKIAQIKKMKLPKA